MSLATIEVYAGVSVEPKVCDLVKHELRVATRNSYICNSQLVYVQLATHVLLMHHSFGMNDSYEILLADSKLEGITD